MMRFSVTLAHLLLLCSINTAGHAADADKSPATPTNPTTIPSWRPLFDGKTLAGWHSVGDGQWVVEEGAIVGRTQTGAKLYGLLVSDGVYHDFTVRLKFKSIRGNSGFYIRTVVELPDKAHGLQIEIDPRNNTGGIYESYGRNWIAKPDPAAYAKFFRPDEWNDLMVDARGGDVTVTVNGQTSAQVRGDPSRLAGQLALQMHAGNEMLVMFKDIEIQGEPKKGPDKRGPTQPRRITPTDDGVLVLPARHSRLTAKNLAFMPEWDALGFWRATDQAAWEVEVKKAGVYDVSMEWSVNDANASNPFVVEATPVEGGDAKPAAAPPAAAHRLEAKTPSTGRWDVYRRQVIGQIELQAGVQQIALKPNGQFKNSLMDLRELRLTPRPQAEKGK